MAFWFYPLIGLVCGSTANMLIYRLNKGISLFKPSRSICPKCRKKIAWHDLIPLVSYWLLQGKCRVCHKSISLRYFLVEFSFLLIAILGLVFNISLAQLFFYLFLALVFFSDLEYREIPYTFSLGTLAFLVLAIGYQKLNWINPAFVVVFGLLIKLAEKFHYKKEVFGGGDVLLFAILGLGLSGEQFFLFFYLSFVIGMICSVGLILAKRTSLKNFLPFAPFIIVAYLITSFWGTQALAAYWGLFGVK